MKRQGVATLWVIGSLLAVGLAGCTLFGPGTKAVIQLDMYEGTVPLVIAFNGTGSTGTDGISTYHWQFGTGDDSYEAFGNYTYNQAGTFTVSLTVRAANGRA
jgi:PKD repeat protein